MSQWMDKTYLVFSFEKKSPTEVRINSGYQLGKIIPVGVYRRISPPTLCCSENFRDKRIAWCHITGAVISPYCYIRERNFVVRWLDLILWKFQDKHCSYNTLGVKPGFTCFLTDLLLISQALHSAVFTKKLCGDGLYLRIMFLVGRPISRVNSFWFWALTDFLHLTQNCRIFEEKTARIQP